MGVLGVSGVSEVVVLEYCNKEGYLPPSNLPGQDHAGLSRHTPRRGRRGRGRGGGGGGGREQER